MILVVVAAGFIVLNLLAWMHARSLMRFSTDGTVTKRPDELTLMENVKVLFTGVNIPRPENKGTPADYQLPFETFRFPGYGGHSLEAWHIPHPSAHSIVLMFHGHANVKSSLLPMAAVFHELGYAALLVDFYGSGGSSGDSTTVGVYEADDVTAAFHFARKQWPERKRILHGVSMGSAALLRAVSKDKLSPYAIILEAPFDRFLGTVKNRFKLMGLPSFPAAHLLVFWGGVQEGFNAFSHNPVEYAEAVTCPAMVLHGELDVRATVEESKAVCRAMQGVKYFHVFPGIGHRILISHYPDKWRKHVANFFDYLEDPNPDD